MVSLRVHILYNISYATPIYELVREHGQSYGAHFV